MRDDVVEIISWAYGVEGVEDQRMRWRLDERWSTVPIKTVGGQRIRIIDIMLGGRKR